jgi:hypothetical protein
MTHERGIPSETPVQSCRCPWPQCPWSSQEAELGVGAAGNLGLALAGLLAAMLIWSASRHGALPYGPADLGLLLVVAAFVATALLVKSPARKTTRAVQGRTSTPASFRYCQGHYFSRGRVN